MTVFVQLTNGFGNNLFQIIAGKLLAHRLDRRLEIIPPWNDYYGLSSLLDILPDIFSLLSSHPKNVAQVNDDNYWAVMCLDPAALANRDVVLSGYFEDYRYFCSNRDLISSWFSPVSKSNTTDLVFHFRTGDRLFMKNEFESKPRTEDYVRAIDQFKFNRLHIVSDLPELRNYTVNELTQLTFHNAVQEKDSVGPDTALKYLNDVVDCLVSYNPVFETGDICHDFNKIRSFDKILFEHGTMAWWAAFISQASQVSVYGPWRKWKGNKNKNLSSVEISSWSKWGENK